MSKNKGGSSNSNSSPPKPPESTNEYYYVDGTLQSSRTKVGKNHWATNVYRTPEEQAIENQSLKFISDLVPQAQQAFDVSPEGIQAYKDAYTQPQIRALNQSYDQALGAATNSASSAGLRNSVGFENYRANQLDKNRAEGLADIAANAELMGYELPRQRLAPFADAFNLYNAALSGEQANQMATANPVMQGQSQSNAFNLGNYANMMNFYNAQNQPKQSGGGFLNFLGVR